MSKDAVVLQDPVAEPEVLKITLTLEGEGYVQSDYSLRMDAENAKKEAAGEDPTEYDFKSVEVVKGKSVTLLAKETNRLYEFSHYELTNSEGNTIHVSDKRLELVTVEKASTIKVIFNKKKVHLVAKMKVVNDGYNTQTYAIAPLLDVKEGETPCSVSPEEQVVDLGGSATVTATEGTKWKFVGWYHGAEMISEESELSLDNIFGDAENMDFTTVFAAFEPQTSVVDDSDENEDEEDSPEEPGAETNLEESEIVPEP